MTGYTLVGVNGQDEGNNLGFGAYLNFTGAGVTASISGDVLTVNIPGGGAGGTPALPFTSVQFNNAGAFGGNSRFTFDVANSKLGITGQVVLGNIDTTPTATANSAALYNATEGSGGTGVYVRSTTVDDELCSKTKAIVFGIIF